MVVVLRARAQSYLPCHLPQVPWCRLVSARQTPLLFALPTQPPPPRINSLPHPLLFVLASDRLLTLYLVFFFFNNPAPPEISPLPLPAALPIPPTASRSPASTSFCGPPPSARTMTSTASPG